MSKAESEEKPIFYSICEHGRTEPWTWGAEFAGSWRTTSDIHASWTGMMNCYEGTADLWKYQQPGAYNDPDMLEVGVGNLSDTQYLSHFVLWCMMNAPLILGMDVSQLKDEHLAIITNPTLIALNQDSKLLQASRHRLMNGLDLLIKPLSGNRVAVCFFNKSDEKIDDFEFDLAGVSLRDARVEVNFEHAFLVKDLLEEGMIFDSLNVTIPSLEAYELKLYLVSVYSEKVSIND